MNQIINYLLFSLTLLSITLISSSQVTKTDIDKAIDIPALKHPYLYFTEEEKPVLIERIKIDQECNDILEKLKAEAQMWLYMPVDKNIPIQGKNTRAGWTEYDNDGKYAEYYSSTQRNAFHLAFLYQMTGEQKYADKAFEFADAFCDLTTWTRRAHEFPIIYSRIMPWNVSDDQINFNFDHYNGDAGRTMAAVYDWLYPALDEAQRDRIRGALIEKVVTRVRGDYEFHWWATAYRCNWCGVCNSGVGLTGLALLTENPQLTDIVAESYNRINSMFNELGEDGGWQEGGGYWNYALHTSTFFADALNRITKGKYNLFENERLKNNPVNFPIYLSLPEKISLNFEDSGGGGLLGSSHLINKLATETKNKQAAWYRDEFYGAGNDIFDIVWPRSEINPEPPKNSSIHFETIDWWVMRSDFKNPENVLVAGKAGMNDDPHHGHLDIGHFVVHWQNEYFIRDIGKDGGYDEKYFDDLRWDYPQASSIGHNVVFVNGEKQISAKMRKQEWIPGVGGDVEEFRTSQKLDYVRMNPTKAYPNKELKEWKRHIILEKPEITIALDEIKAEKGSSLVVRFHPGVDFEVEKDFVFLEGEKGKMAVIPIAEDFSIKTGKHACHFINATNDFFWVPYFDVEVSSTKEKTNIATVILPVNSIEEAKQIVASRKLNTDNSGNITVSFLANRKELSYEFENRKGSLVLKK
ncbi:MAG: heparinase II/III family protein [Bacteroidetes bacterium]|nr:heparinase II/III family protein [Bacteroidota bacterium]